MSWLLLILAWLAFARGSYLLIEADWLRSFDLDRSDRCVFAFLSLFGPVSFLAASLIWIMGRPKSERAREVIKERR